MKVVWGHLVGRKECCADEKYVVENFGRKFLDGKFGNCDRSVLEKITFEKFWKRMEKRMEKRVLKRCCGPILESNLGKFVRERN